MEIITYVFMDKTSNSERYFISTDEFHYCVLLQYIVGYTEHCKIFPMIKIVAGKRIEKNVRELIISWNN